MSPATDIYREQYFLGLVSFGLPPPQPRRLCPASGPETYGMGEDIQDLPQKSYASRPLPDLRIGPIGHRYYPTVAQLCTLVRKVVTA
jgi:hypothetical protein